MIFGRIGRVLGNFIWIIANENSKKGNQFRSLYDCTESLYSRTKMLYSHPDSLYSHPDSLYSHPESLYSHTESQFSRPEYLYSHPKSLYSRAKSLYSRPEVLNYRIIKVKDLVFLKYRSSGILHYCCHYALLWKSEYCLSNQHLVDSLYSFYRLF